MWKVMFLVCLTFVVGCGGQEAFTVADTDSDSDTDTDSDSDSDTDSDIDSDVDSDTDTDTDSDTDSDTDTDPDAGTDTDTDSDTDTETETETATDTEPCVAVTDCDEDEVCGFVSGDCYVQPVPDPAEQFWFCWDDLESCNAFDGYTCNYSSPDLWDYYLVGGAPLCQENYWTCPDHYPTTPACCLKNNGEGDCLTEAFFVWP